MQLRPHHLLCIQKFTGHGYSAAFTAHMCSIVLELTHYPQTTLSMVQGCDELCGKCPNKEAGACISLTKVSAMDRAVLDVCGLAYGNRLPAAALMRRARERILETDEFRRICGGCVWFELCKRTGLAHERHNEKEQTLQND